jgi:hypothetical protein
VRVNPYMVLAAFAADWSRLSRLLAPGARQALGRHLAELRDTGVQQEQAAERAARTVLEALPAEEAERLRRHGGTRLAGAPTTGSRYEGYGAADLCLLVLDNNPMVGPVLGPIRQRLLREPSLEWTEGATDRRLIVLSDDGGRRRLPSFQFEAGSMPWEIVLDVNSVLHAGTDPWGAADWWLSRTTWWDGIPADLLGRGRDTELLGAARALAATEGEW